MSSAAEMTKPGKSITRSSDRTHRISYRQSNGEDLHPAWVAFIRHCRELGFGEISQLKVQDGIPVMAEETTKKIKFS